MCHVENICWEPCEVWHVSSLVPRKLCDNTTWERNWFRPEWRKAKDTVLMSFLVQPTPVENKSYNTEVEESKSFYAAKFWHSALYPIIELLMPLLFLLLSQSCPKGTLWQHNLQKELVQTRMEKGRGHCPHECFHPTNPCGKQKMQHRIWRVKKLLCCKVPVFCTVSNYLAPCTSPLSFTLPKHWNQNKDSSWQTSCQAELDHKWNH